MSEMITRKKKLDSATIISAAIVACIYLAVFIAEQFIPATSMLFTVLKKGATYALVAVSMNLCNGFTGIFSLGQAGFMLIGAFTYGILTIPVAERMSVYQYYNGGLVQFALPWYVGMLLAGLVAAFFAFLIGLPVLRLKSDYLAIASLGLLINSTFGRALKAIRDDEIAAEAMGIRLASHKRLAFCISSFFAGVGGAMLAMYQNTVQAKGFTTAMTYEILLIVVIGGIGSVTGSCLSSFLFVACSEWWLRFLDQKQMIGTFEVPLLRNGFRLVVFSIIIMIVVLFFRQGIMGTKELPDVIRRLQGKKVKGGAAK